MLTDNQHAALDKIAAKYEDPEARVIGVGADGVSPIVRYPSGATRVVDRGGKVKSYSL